MAGLGEHRYRTGSMNWARQSLDLSTRLHETGLNSTGTLEMDVSSWLRDLGLENYAQPFRAHQIDPEVLPCLTAEDLIAVGVTSVGDRRKLLDAIAALRDGRAPAIAGPLDTA